MSNATQHSPPPPGIASLRALVVVAMLWNGCAGFIGWLSDAARTAERLCAGVQVGAPIGDLEERARASGFRFHRFQMRSEPPGTEHVLAFAMLQPNRPTCSVEIDHGIVVWKRLSSE